ncbi:hypothetical protein BCR37DRAFT_385624 [Protomyces lactucae-debilis]|uniref:Uncharacterized protein n=1 Tax=Protomyces lactucae-debilis TaxID=2754530 RepID=A0A1Y2FQ80_PROLT|nr:uncharacterized protein BCR37DRAFT_385624 [Protomyces lactucae-debilis]ORY86140.1 hypothetical protein BCR37DRAFT_385624 [Protomyces lactucae-debilis]
MIRVQKHNVAFALLVFAALILLTLITRSHSASASASSWSSYGSSVGQAASSVVKAAKGSDAWPINAKGFDSGLAEDTLRPLQAGQKPPVRGTAFANEHGHYCKWVFDEYIPSSYEVEWTNLTTVVNDEVCRVVAQQKHRAASLDIVTRVMQLVSGLDTSINWSEPDTAPLEDAKLVDEYFSRMRYKRVCFNEETQVWAPGTGTGDQLIEPLWGMLRDPFDHWCDYLGYALRPKPPGYQKSTEGQSKAHILPQGFAPYRYTLAADGKLPDSWRLYGMPPWHSSLEPIVAPGFGITYRPPQQIHLDLGSSYFAGWTKATEAEEARMRIGAKPPPGKEEPAKKVQNSAASGQWFYDHYHKRGLPFDRFIAVELEPLSPQDAYEQCPEDLVGKYNLINIGLSMDKDKYNTLDLIRRTVRKQDFFVFKLDIDSAPIEMPIINALLKDNPDKGGVSGLIDELMFEHHCNYEPLAGPWELRGRSRKEVGDLGSSYKLFGDLRRKGIRAHSWP